MTEQQFITLEEALDHTVLQNEEMDICIVPPDPAELTNEEEFDDNVLESSNPRDVAGGLVIIHSHPHTCQMMKLIMHL